VVVVKECFWCKSKNIKFFTKRIDDKPVSECLDCGLLLVTNLPDDLSEFYQDEAYFNPAGETSTGYHENYNYISPLYLYWQGSLLNEVARLSGAKTLLEVGCATGNALEMIKARSPQIKTTGIDLSPYAIEQCRAKGIESDVSTINEYANNKRKYDIVFSSETMEHVDDLYEFVESADKLINKSGVFVFYVPGVVKADMAQQKNQYVSLTTSLEHVSYFTSDFLNKAMKQIFGNVSLIQMSTDGEDYIMGVASNNRALVDDMAKFINGLKKFDSKLSDPDSIFNLTIIASKFALFDLADKYLDLLKRDFENSKMTCLAGALVAFNKGELENAKLLFSDYLAKTQTTDELIYKLMHANERELALIYKSQMLEFAQQVEAQRNLKERLDRVENELLDLKHSKIVGSSILARKAIGKTLDPIRRQKKN